MSDMPTPDFGPITLTLEPHELMALCEAATVYDLLADGCLPAALDMVSQTDDGGYTKAMLDSQRTACEKIEDALKPQHDAIRAWVRRRTEEDPDA